MSADPSERLPPWRTFLASDDAIRELLRSSRTLAVVGSFPDADDERKLIERGYRILPIRRDDATPRFEERVDVVLVFDASAPLEALADAAHAQGAKALWLERGVVDAHAALHAARRGLLVAMDRSFLVECTMHFPDDETGYS